MQGIRVYSASAGAGKTFRLTAECLVLLIKNPSDYRYILAVTFTNKASEEMKERLVHELYVLSSGQKSDYLSYLLASPELINYAESQIRKLATTALAMIIHDYGRFSYLTIDSFFQRILRSFMRELRLNANYDLELDSNAVVNDVVDKLLDDTARDEELLRWVMDAVNLKMIESGRWDFREELKSLFSELFKEKFAYIDRQYQLNKLDRNSVHRLIKTVDGLHENLEKFRMGFWRKASDILTRYSLSIDDFSYKATGPVAALLKLKKEVKEPGVRMREARDNKDKLLGKALLQRPDSDRIFTEINDVLVKYLDWYDANIFEYNSCKLVKQQAFMLGLIVDGRQRMADYLNENDRFFIGDTPLFLSELAEGNDSPFIYEKSGLFLKHYLIDEFQDTSEKQWEAFLPLLREAMAWGDNFGMVVGDVKQSIFRWRNGNWRLLANDIDQQLPVQRFVLNENWRSKSNVVCFNNSIFKLIPQWIQEHFNAQAEPMNELLDKTLATSLLKNYSDVQQIPKSGVGGFVRLRFFDKEKTDDSWKIPALKTMAEELEKLIEIGYRPGDIAILVRTHAEAAKTTRFLLDYQNNETESKQVKYQVVSTESLLLAANPAIIIITGLMRYLVQPDNLPALYTAVINYRLHIADDFDCFHHISVNDNVDKLLAVLPQKLVSVLQRNDYGDMVSLTEQIIESAQLNRNEATTPFLDVFLQMLTEFSMSRGMGLYAFVDWWNSEGMDRSLQIPESRDAVRVLTIHQAKGLGFPVVFVPFCDFDLEPSRNPIIWCNTLNTPFDSIPFLPVKYKKDDMGNSLFFKEFFDEKLNSYQDNLNIFYVAATRAKDALYVFCPHETSSENIAGYLHKAVVATDEMAEVHTLQLNTYYDKELQVFEIGELPVPMSEPDNIVISFSHHVNLNTRQVRLKGSFGKLSDSGDIARGLMYHAIFEKVKRITDINNSVNQVVNDLQLPAEKASDLKREVQNAVEHSEIKRWFTDFDEIYNETWIVSPDGSLHKPDRVMRFGEHYEVVDYKFGKKNDARYQKQIREYLGLLNKMGYKHCTGYVWYVFEHELLKIENDKVEIIKL